MATWRELIQEEMDNNGDSFDNLVDFVLGGGKSDDWKTVVEDLDAEFHDGYGGEGGCYFQLWTKDFVYFPICYDGAEWCGSASRNPNGKPLSHQGG